MSNISASQQFSTFPQVGISVPGATLGDRSTSCLGRHLCQSDNDDCENCAVVGFSSNLLYCETIANSVCLGSLTNASGLQERILTLHSLVICFLFHIKIYIWCIFILFRCLRSCSWETQVPLSQHFSAPVLAERNSTVLSSFHSVQNCEMSFWFYFF